MSGIVGFRYLLATGLEHGALSKNVIPSLLCGIVTLFEVYDGGLDRILDRKETKSNDSRRDYLTLMKILLSELEFAIVILRRSGGWCDVLTKMERASYAIAAHLKLIHNSASHKAVFPDWEDELLGKIESGGLCSIPHGRARSLTEGVDARVAEADIEFFFSGLQCDSEGVYELPSSSGPHRMKKAVVESILSTHYLSLAFNIEEILLEAFGVTGRLHLFELQPQGQVNLGHVDIFMTCNYSLLHAEYLLDPSYVRIVSDNMARTFNTAAHYLFTWYEKYEKERMVSLEVDRQIIFNLSYTLALELALHLNRRSQPEMEYRFEQDLIISAMHELDVVRDVWARLCKLAQSLNSTDPSGRCSLHYRFGPQHEDDSITELVFDFRDNDGFERRETLYRGPRHPHPDNRPCDIPDDCVLCHIRSKRHRESFTQES
ncbi:uncharacterized protein PV07_01524 [Cladophialophora immunda]|uniref:Uncharacterized protein n=1 Tax=Cladophialophora immunda TaxID=569365 RepID=A0A0D2BB17_9EURO|nr:uncharacterized protein PV07_01524 [Cladophialophora immunda]KIW34767.1 hypothetical protein PV07_01524 [Cladophialophora immunda]